MERLNPMSLRELEQLVEAHGADRVIAAVHEINARLQRLERMARLADKDGR